MIAVCLIRIAMLEASRLKNLSVAQISFVRALTETRLFFKLLSATPENRFWPLMWEAYVQCCSQYRVRFKPDRRFPRDKQEYRRKSRGLEKRPRGRQRKYKEASPLPQPETRKGAKGQEFLLN